MFLSENQLNTVLRNIEFQTRNKNEQVLKLTEAAEAMDIKSLASRSVDHAELCGQLSGWITAKMYNEQGISLEHLVKEIQRTLLRGADDSWSGRTNDMMRAKFDGYRRFAEKFLEMADKN